MLETLLMELEMGVQTGLVEAKDMVDQVEMEEDPSLLLALEV